MKIMIDGIIKNLKMSLNKEQKEKYVLDFLNRQLVGMSNLTKTDIIEKKEIEINDKIINLEETTKTFFNDTTIKSN